MKQLDHLLFFRAVVMIGGKSSIFNTQPGPTTVYQNIQHLS